MTEDIERFAVYTDEKYPHICSIDVGTTKGCVDLPLLLVQEFRAAKKKYDALEARIFALVDAEENERRRLYLKMMVSLNDQPPEQGGMIRETPAGGQPIKYATSSTSGTL